MVNTKRGAAGLSIASNTVLIAIKLAAGALTGSIAIMRRSGAASRAPGPKLASTAMRMSS